MSQYADEIINPGDRISKLASLASKASYPYSQTIDVITGFNGNFRAPVGWRWKKHILRAMLEGKMYQMPQNDGAGNKPGFYTLADSTSAFGDLAWEIAAMCADDVARSGGFPSHFEANQIDFKNVTDKNFRLAQAVVDGYGHMLYYMQMANITGETAIMKYSITAFCDTEDPEQLILTWSGICTGLMHRDKLIDGSRIEPGQPIVGLIEPKSYRCNGGSFHTENLKRLQTDARLQKKYGDDYWKEYCRMLTVPSTSYAKPIAKVHGWLPDGNVEKAKAEITGICHWTGGGIRKLVEILPPGIGAELDSMPSPSKLQLIGQEIAQGTKNELDDLHAYETLHGGPAVLIIGLTPKDSKIMIEELGFDGVVATIIGKTTESKEREVLIHSRFNQGGIVSSKDLE